MREIQVNVAYRWFLRFNLTAKIPNASTLSQNRRRRFQSSRRKPKIPRSAVPIRTVATWFGKVSPRATCQNVPSHTIPRSTTSLTHRGGNKLSLHGISKVREHRLLAAAAQNMKKIAQIPARLLRLKTLGIPGLQGQIRTWARKLAYPAYWQLGRKDWAKAFINGI